MLEKRPPCLGSKSDDLEYIEAEVTEKIREMKLFGDIALQELSRFAHYCGASLKWIEEIRDGVYNLNCWLLDRSVSGSSRDKQMVSDE